jgi:SAM-dependent methyltransferase
MFCEYCTNAQLSVAVNPSIIYSNYPYVTSKSQTMRNHFQLVWQEIIKESKPKLLVEIGSNDGLFLEFCHGQGVEKVIGIDPAANLTPKQGPDGIWPICSLFDEDAARQVVDHNQDVDVVVARHVFCHVDDWREFMQNLEAISNPNTVIMIEVPYVLDLLQGLEFDTIYHEHLSYISVKAMQELLREFMFHIHKIVRFSIHGGAILLVLRRNDCDLNADSSVAIFEELEAINLNTWADFRTGAKRKIEQLKDMVGSMSKTQRVVGFGASAKSTVWINACGFTSKQIQFICDCTPEKQGKYSPGNDIPIYPESDLRDRKADCAILFAWNFKREILAKNHEFISHGGRFLIPAIHIETT